MSAKQALRQTRAQPLTLAVAPHCNRAGQPYIGPWCRATCPRSRSRKPPSSGWFRCSMRGCARMRCWGRSSTTPSMTGPSTWKSWRISGRRWCW